MTERGVPIEELSPLQKKSQRNWKKSVKKCWQEGGGVVLYLSAKRWGKRMTSARSPWKEPMSVQMFRFVPRNSWTIQVQKVQKLRKKDLTKNHFGGKINRSSAERLRRTGPWKLNNIEKLVRNLLSVWKNTKNNSKSNSHRTQAIACWANKI